MKRTLIFLTVIVIACTGLLSLTNKSAEEPQFIPQSKQRSGNAAKGYEYLTSGDYLKSGIPYSYYLLARKKDSSNFLKRSGLNKDLPFDYTAVKAPNGEMVVAPNCMQCHAQVFDGKFVMGLGNSLSDFTINRTSTASMAEKFLKLAAPKKYEAAKNFFTTVKTVSPQLMVNTRGVNLADGLAALLAAHRDPVTLKWSDKALMPIPAVMIPTDVPAWWMLKKKNGMFYNGFGRGDFGRFLMASNLLTVTDTVEAASVDSHFNDVLAYLKTINPPAYPKEVNKQLAASGQKIFNRNCASCHGTYGEDGKYPNLLIPQSIIQTDSALFSSNYSSPQFLAWFNKSWFTTGEHPAKLEPYRGYIAPPLDGIWITAPYLHNGSVPDLETLLNSKKRPVYWKRDFVHPAYNYIIPGWNYEAMKEPGGSDVYNTMQTGFGNGGHYFGDNLSDEERKAVIEYLKLL
ncbi:MAG: c-type cytochrome [Ferruginibacter sp.]